MHSTAHACEPPRPPPLPVHGGHDTHGLVSSCTAPRAGRDVGQAGAFGKRLAAYLGMFQRRDPLFLLGLLLRPRARLGRLRALVLCTGGGVGLLVRRTRTRRTLDHSGAATLPSFLVYSCTPSYSLLPVRMYSLGTPVLVYPDALPCPCVHARVKRFALLTGECGARAVGDARQDLGAEQGRHPIRERQQGPAWPVVGLTCSNISSAVRLPASLRDAEGILGLAGTLRSRKTRELLRSRIRERQRGAGVNLCAGVRPPGVRRGAVSAWCVWGVTHCAACSARAFAAILHRFSSACTKPNTPPRLYVSTLQPPSRVLARAAEEEGGGGGATRGGCVLADEEQEVQ